MAKIDVRDSRDARWVTGRTLASPHLQEVVSEGELDAQIQIHARGDEIEPQLLEIRADPNVAFGVHSHDQSEIIYVVAGEMRLGTKTLGPGSSVSIEGGAYYSFSAGPEGLRFLNFRPRCDFTYNLPKSRSGATAKA